jgi:chromosome segregation ATPase
VESITAYYNEILVNQLHKQAEHFERKLRDMEIRLTYQLSDLEKEFKELCIKEKDFKDSMDVLKKTNHSLQKKYESCQSQINRKKEDIIFVQEHNLLLLKDKASSGEVVSSRKQGIEARYNTTLEQLDRDILAIQQKINDILSSIDSKDE